MPTSDNQRRFVVQELVPNGQTVVLSDSDMPFGRPREMVAFETGGETDIAEDGIYNPGSEQVVLQVMNSNKHRPMIIKGAFRDRLFGVVGHARSMRDAFDALKLRANPVRISWGGDERVGLVWKTLFGEEGANDISYEITFYIAVPPTGVATAGTVDLRGNLASIEDLRAQMKAQLIVIQLQLLAPYLTQSSFTTLSGVLNSISIALDYLSVSTTAFEKMTGVTPQAAVARANQVIAGCTSVVGFVQALRTTLSTFRADQASQYINADNSVSWWTALYNGQLFINQILDAMRSIMAKARTRVRQSTQLYRVQPGDTLESIALYKLGSRARSGDLGIRADQLVPGKYIRIPESA